MGSHHQWVSGKRSLQAATAFEVLPSHLRTPAYLLFIEAQRDPLLSDADLIDMICSRDLRAFLEERAAQHQAQYLVSPAIPLPARD